MVSAGRLPCHVAANEAVEQAGDRVLPDARAGVRDSDACTRRGPAYVDRDPAALVGMLDGVPQHIA